MDEFQPRIERTVIAFAQRGAPAAGALSFASCFTPRDRMDLSDWRDTARTAGYDRLIIHDRDCGDAQEVGNFLSVYRRGESWSRWGFARQGRFITSWCCLRSTDTGQFDGLAKALDAVLTGRMPEQVGAMMIRVNQGAVVTELAARRKSCIGRLGSAA